MTKIERAYIAGFFDADGSVTVIKGRLTKRKPHHIYTIALCFYNNDRNVLEWFQQKMGGRLYYRPRARNHHEMASQLYMRTQTEILQCLSTILPYLKTKRQSAELAYKFLKLREPTKHLHSAHNPLTDEQLEILKQLRQANIKRSRHAKPL